MAVKHVDLRSHSFVFTLLQRLLPVFYKCKILVDELSTLGGEKPTLKFGLLSTLLDVAQFFFSTFIFKRAPLAFQTNIIIVGVVFFRLHRHLGHQEQLTEQALYPNLRLFHSASTGLPRLINVLRHVYVFYFTVAFEMGVQFEQAWMF